MNKKSRDNVIIRYIKEAQDAHSCDNLNEAAAKIFRACKKAADCQSGYLLVFKEKNNTPEVLYLENYEPDEAAIKNLVKSVKGFCSNTNIINKSIYINNFNTSEWITLWPGNYEQVQNILFSPITQNNRIIGILCMADKKGGFDEEDLLLASVFSHISSISLNNLAANIRIAESENKYRNLFNNIPLGLYVTNSMEQIVDMNQKMLEILDIDKLEDFKGKDLISYYIDPQDRIEWQNNLEKGKKVQYLETRFRGPDGNVLWVSENANLIEGYDGQEYCEATIEDITTRKRAEEAFTKTYLELDTAYKELNDRAKWMESLNKLLFELAGEMTEENIFTTVLSNLANNFSIEFAGFGIFNEDLTNITFKKINTIHPDLEKEITPEYPLEKKDLSILNSSARRVIVMEDSKELFETIETEFMKLLYRLSKKNRGSMIFIPVRYENIIFGNIIVILKKCLLSANQKYYLENMADFLSMAIENQNLYERLSYSYVKLESAQEAMKKQERIKAMGQIASGITHDINNTLAPITLYTEALIETETNLSERATRYLKTIQNAVSDIENVTQRLRTFYKQDEEHLSEYISIKDLFEEIIELTRPKWESIPNKDGIIIRIETVINDSKASISGSRSDIREALVNCVFNAVDAMPAGGTIVLSQSIDEDYIKITVEDEGIGMTEDQLSHCLEPFYTTKGAAGTGLGLAEVYGMMQRHDGKVEIESKSDYGTRINLLFPPVINSEKEEITSLTEKKMPSMNILCVDDDLRILEGLKEMFSLDGHITETAQSGPEALRILRDLSENEKNFDVIVTDLGMPGMDGYEFAKASKGIYPDIPIIMLSGWGSQINKSDHKSEDICCILSKPPRIKALREALSNNVKGGIKL